MTPAGKNGQDKGAGTPIVEEQERAKVELTPAGRPGAPMSDREIQVRAMARIAQVVLEALREAGPDGIPGGYIYAVIMETGLTLKGFEVMMSVLCEAGKARKEGELYFAREEGKQEEGTCQR